MQNNPKTLFIPSHSVLLLFLYFLLSTILNAELLLVREDFYTVSHLSPSQQCVDGLLNGVAGQRSGAL